MCLGETGVYAKGLGILAPHFARRGEGSELREEALRICPACIPRSLYSRRNYELDGHFC